MRRPHRFPLTPHPFPAIAACVFTLCSLLLAACASGANDSIGRFDAPRTVHLAPDGRRVIIADLGTGHDDGRVLAINPDTRASEVLMKGLPSTRKSGQRYADLAGPSGAAMAADGTVCTVIGDADRPGRGFNTLRCTDGLVVDLKAFEASQNPDGLEVASNPFDVIWDGRNGWLISDAAANTVLAIDRKGAILVIGVFAGRNFALEGLPEGVPSGLALIQSGRGERDVEVALFNGGYASILLGSDRAPFASGTSIRNPIALDGSEKVPTLLSYVDGTITFVGLAPGVIPGLDRPTGLARLEDGRYVVCEEARARCRIVGAKR